MTAPVKVIADSSTQVILHPTSSELWSISGHTVTIYDLLTHLPTGTTHSLEGTFVSAICFDQSEIIKLYYTTVIGQGDVPYLCSFQGGSTSQLGTLDDEPRGLTFNRDFTQLYVATLSTIAMYHIADGTFTPIVSSSDLPSVRPMTQLGWHPNLEMLLVGNEGSEAPLWFIEPYGDQILQIYDPVPNGAGETYSAEGFTFDCEANLWTIGDDKAIKSAIDGTSVRDN